MEQEQRADRQASEQQKQESLGVDQLRVLEVGHVL
jgi:hypothetical protein